MNELTLPSGKISALIEHITNMLASPWLYSELALVGIIMAIALGTSWSARHLAARRSKTFTSSFLSLIGPATAVLLLNIAPPLATGFIGKTVFLLPLVGKVAMAWLAIEASHLIFRNPFAVKIISTGIIAYTLLTLLGLWQPTVEYLDAQAFSIGKVRISLLGVFEAAIGLFMLIWLARSASRLAERGLQRIDSIDYNTRAIILKLLTATLYAVAFLITLNMAGIDLTALAIFGGALGVGLGLGLQEIAANFMSGIILLMERTLRVGDCIQIGNETGFLRRLSVRYALLETVDGREIMIPNDKLISDQVTNLTFSNTRGRVEIRVGVAYDSDLELVDKLLLEAAQEHPRCLKDPEPNCFLQEFGDSSINFLLVFWVEDVKEGRLEPQSDVMHAIVRKFRQHKVEIPFPQRDLHIKSQPPAQTAA